MKQDAQRLADIIRRRKKVKVVTHIDADGICAGAIASMALERAGIEWEVDFVKQLDPETVDRLRGSMNGMLVWFTDLGSGQLEMLKGIDCVISDHHTPSLGYRQQAAGSRQEGTDGPNPEHEAPNTDYPPTVNPHLHGLSGALELSGAGAAYLVAREMDGANIDLAALAIVGAIGDMQDGQNCRLTGLNREIMEDGKRAGVLDWAVDIRYFGRETRPVHKMLQYSSDPAISGITGSEQGALAFLQALGIALKDGEDWRSWTMLDRDEKRLVASALVQRAISDGIGHRNARRILGEAYTLIAEAPGTELHDAKEFSTLLNSCGRHDKAPLGLRVCRGDRSEGLTRALSLLQGHRRSLVEGIQFVKEKGVEKRKYLQHFHAGTAIQDTLVGVVAGMLLGSGEAGADPSLPMIAFAVSEDGKGVKVSARAARALVEKGLDLSLVMKAASAAVGGSGGGHNVAAGGMIPEGAEERFLEAAGNVISEQICGKDGKARAR
jgi:RecJ-like exonuclease